MSLQLGRLIALIANRYGHMIYGLVEAYFRFLNSTAPTEHILPGGRTAIG
jgi:hypothetical protein